MGPSQVHQGKTMSLIGINAAPAIQRETANHEPHIFTP